MDSTTESPQRTEQRDPKRSASNPKIEAEHIDQAITRAEHERNRATTEAVHYVTPRSRW